MPRIQLWAATLTLTLFGIAVVIVVHVISSRFLYSAIGDAVYLILFGVAGAAAVLIGRVVRWLNSG